MNRLPPHHVPRPRLTGRTAGHRVIVVEAAAGYGKSVLAAELVDHWRSVGIDVQSEHAGVSGSLLAARFHQAVRRAGFTEAAAAAEGKQDPVELLDTLVTSLATENCTFVFDDAHNVEPTPAHSSTISPTRWRESSVSSSWPGGCLPGPAACGEPSTSSSRRPTWRWTRRDPGAVPRRVRARGGRQRRPRRSTRRRGAGRRRPSWPRPGRPGPVRR